MNKLLKLIYTNILKLFDINKIIVARNDGVKSNLEKKLVITGIITLFYGYLIYFLFSIIKFNNTYNILTISFIIATIMSFIINFTTIESTILKSDDTEMLFAMPVTKNQILFSKLFIVYLKNLLFTAIVMIAGIISFGNAQGNITDTLLIMDILATFIVPLIPIVVTTIITYFSNYLKIKYNNSFMFRLSKLFIKVLVIIICIMGLSKVNVSSISDTLDVLIKLLSYIYPLIYLFSISISKLNMIAFIGLILIPIAIIYIYTLIISNNYLKICSILKGINKKNKFIYKRRNNWHQVWGIVRKEFINLFNNKFYLMSSYGVLIFSTIILFVFFKMVDISVLYKIENIDIYINLYVPTLLVFLVTISGSTISSMSLEKNNLQMLRTMPLSMGKILVGKWIPNILIGIIFVLINGSLVWYYLDLSKWGIVFSYLIPFVALLFISFTSLVLDYRFIEKNQIDDNAIIKQRFIIMVPMFLSMLISFGTLFLPPYKQYEFLLGSYVLAMLLFMVIEVIYLRLNRKKLINNLFS